MYSIEHKNFVKKEKIRKLLIKITQLLIFIAFIVIWQILADKNIINPFITSSPKEVFYTIVNLHKTNNLYNHIIITVYETLISFSLGIIIGLLISSLLWWNRFISKVVDPYLTVLNSLPKVALGPIIIIWVGADIKSIILMALLISSIVSIINIYQGFENIDKDKLRLMQSFNAKKYQTFFMLVLPGSLTSIVNTLKINISMSLIGVIMGELLVSKEGIGYLIMYGSQVFNLDLVMSGIIILAIVSIIMYYLVTLLEKYLIKKITK